MTQPALVGIESLDLSTLIALAERIAIDRADGHFTVMRFTTGWKCMAGTPDLDVGGRDEVSALASFRSMREALVSFVCSR